jgi:hypothetical protein
MAKSRNQNRLRGLNLGLTWNYISTVCTPNPVTISASTEPAV